MAAAAPPSLPAQVAVELPSSDARYLQNPKPRYPPISHRLGEQGTVQIQVLVTDQGIARDARIQSSSGFSRLDNAALSSVLTWRFVPGKRAGVAETMWFTVPITFDLK
jgi:protein TonB